MKKIISTLCIIAMVFAMAGCAGTGQQKSQNINPGNTNLNVTPTTYRDGTYSGEGDKTTSGNQTATVGITGGKITSVVLRNVDVNGKEISSDISGTNRTTGGTTTGTTGNITGGTTGGATTGNIGTTTPGTTTGTPAGTTTGTNMIQMRNDLAAAIIAKQSADVNFTGGDQAMINNWKLAVRRALDKARK